MELRGPPRGVVGIPLSQGWVAAETQRNYLDVKD